MNQPLRSNRKSDSIISHVLVVHCIAMYFVQVTLASVVLMSFNQLNPTTIHHKCKFKNNNNNKGPQGG